MAETVKKPGDSAVDIFGNAISPLVQKASASIIGATTGYSLAVTSGSNTSSLVGSNLQFNEVHIYKFPFLNTFHSIIQTQCSTDIENIAPVVYLSELDSVEWRIGLLEALSPKSVLSAALGPVCDALSGNSKGLCMGVWGPVYPRRGFITHQSEVVGSAADVYRAVSIASLNGELFHTTLSRLMFIPDPDKDKLQLIYPHPSGCIRIGQNPATWESGKTSPNGKYAWVYWRHRECCIF